MRYLSFFIKMGLVIAVISLVCIFMVKPGTMEFYMTLVALIAGLLVSIGGFIYTHFKGDDYGGKK